jgi:hypothetical protein
MVLDEMEYTYLMDREKRIAWKKGNFRPDMPATERNDHITNIVDVASTLEDRASKKDPNLRGKGEIKNKMLMLRVRATEANSGNLKTFFWNVGPAGGRDIHSKEKNLDKLRRFLGAQTGDMDANAAREYADVGVLEFGQGFKITGVVLRTVVRAPAKNLRTVRGQMGIRGLRVRRRGT